WRPAPHERIFTPEGACVYLRERVEKVVWRSRVYQRPDAQGIGRHAAYRVRDTGGHVVCSLWALGTPIEDTLELDEDGHVVKILEPPPQPAQHRTTLSDRRPQPAEHRALPPEVADGIGAIVAATSAPALGPALRAAARRLILTWAPLHGELASMKGDAVRLSNRLRAVLAAGSPSLSDDARRDAALATLTEVALLLGDTLRARAQAHVAALEESAQRALLETPPSPDPDTARVITAAVAALVTSE